MTHAIYNFSAGPAMLPAPVKEQIQAGIQNISDGMSILEISHRSKVFEQIAKQSEQDLRDLLNIPDEFAVIFMHGGGRGQFSAVPLNLRGQATSADYLITGHWSAQAADEAKRYGPIKIVSDTHLQGAKNTQLPSRECWQLDKEAAYFHYTDNETIEGIEFFETPSVGVPLISDMTSSLITKRINWSQFGAVYAAAQKNLGVAGVTIAIVRKNLLSRVRSDTPTILNYQSVYKSGSLNNTPPIFSWYVTSLMLQWALAEGGIDVLAARCATQSQRIYDFIDKSAFYHNDVDMSCRSRINIPFQIENPQLEQQLIEAAEKKGLYAIKGHRKVGGFRVSLYVGMPIAGVDALLAFLGEFERTH